MDVFVAVGRETHRADVIVAATQQESEP